MELKHHAGRTATRSFYSLNRTFYGIETFFANSVLPEKGVLIVPFMELKLRTARQRLEDIAVLIVPFMELKHYEMLNLQRLGVSLNRTFYGIETSLTYWFVTCRDVLIVPFMELKHQFKSLVQLCTKGLNRTFYGIETTQELFRQGSI